MIIVKVVINMNIDYEKIQQSINEYGQYILSCIKNQYGSSLTPEQLQNIESLLNKEFIVIEKPTKEDVEFFSKQAGVTNPKDYSVDYIPSAHGGRTKEDNKIHIYPYTKSFSNCKNDEEIIQLCMDSIVVHEIFHYFIRPNLSNEGETMKDEFGHFITEGLVQYYSEEFAKKYRLGNPKSNYGKNVEFVKQLIASFPDNLTQTQIDKMIFTLNQDELLHMAKNGKYMYEEYVADAKFRKNISSFIVEMGDTIGMKQDDDHIQKILRHYKNMNDKNTMIEELFKNIDFIFKDQGEIRNYYKQKLKNMISDKNIKEEFFEHEEPVHKTR